MRNFSNIPLLLVWIVILTGMSSAQESKLNLDGFWDIKFGSTLAEAKKILQLKKTGTIDEKNSDKEYLVLRDAEFGGRKAKIIALSFGSGGFHTVTLIFSPSAGTDILKFFDSIKNDLNDRYFKTSEEIREFESPYSERTASLAIGSGKGEVVSIWTFKRKDHFENMILLQIDKSQHVMLYYQDKKLLNKKENKNAKDF